jgi:hypothetical protein
VLTQYRLKDRLSYDPETGIWVWLVAHRGIRKGSVAGHARKDGYLIISFDDCRYLAHRLAFLYMEGVMPAGDVDHIDRDKSNGRWSNLRHATKSQNEGNTPARVTNLLKVKGVSRQARSGRNPSKPFQARITIGGKQKSLGYFATPEEAGAAYAEAARQHFGEFAAAA